MLMDIVLNGLAKAITSLAFLIALFAPSVFNFNWMFIQNDSQRHHSNQLVKHSDLPKKDQLEDDSWYFAFQDHAVQLYTFFLAWTALIHQAAIVFLKIVEKQNWEEFSSQVDALHWVIAGFSKGIWWVVLGCFLVGAILLLTGTFSKIDIVVKYKYNRQPDILKKFYVPSWESPITVGRIIIIIVATLFNLWLETLRIMTGLVV